VINRVLVACLAFFAISLEAQAAFLTSQFDVTAIALSDGPADFQSLSSPPDPVTVSAASVGLDVATAGAVAGAGLLTTSADVTSVSGGVTSAVATSHFLGSFAGGGQLYVGIDFTPLPDFPNGSGSGGTTLFVTMMNGATTIFSDYLTGSRLFFNSTPVGSLSTLELTLTSEANAAFLSSAPGAYSTLGLVNFTAAPVPEPETYLLLVSGLLVTRFVVRRRKA
jgi:hypothetical protein